MFLIAVVASLVYLGLQIRQKRYFGTTEEFWMYLQTHYDLEAQREKLKGRLKREVIVRKAS